MSNQASNAREGTSFKVIGQVVDISYHGVEVITQKGNGILGQMMAPINNVSRSQSNQTATTKSSEVSLLTFDEINEGKAKRYSDVRAQLIAENADLNAKVKNFHQRLNELKENLLAGKEVNYAGRAELENVRTEMIPYNVGKVVKVKLQARMYSNTQIAGWNRVKTGGSSLVNTLYTLYLPYSENIDLQQLVDQIASYFKLGTTGSEIEVVHTVLKTRVSRRDDNQIIIEPLSSDTKIKYQTEGGTEKTVSLEGLRSGTESISRTALFKKSSVFGD